MLTVGSCSVFSDEIKDFCVFDLSSVVPSTNACACQLLSICFTKRSVQNSGSSHCRLKGNCQVFFLPLCIFFPLNFLLSSRGKKGIEGS